VVTRLLLPLAILLASAAAASAQTAEPGDAGSSIISRLEKALVDGSSTVPPELLAMASTESLGDFSAVFFAPGTTRAVARVRDRAPLEAALPGDGYTLIVDFFSELANRARIVTARLDIRRPRGGEEASWRIVDLDRLSLVEGLYRLRLDATAQYTARNFSVRSEDLQLILLEGTVFDVVSDEGVTGLVLLGRGMMQFSPAPAVEKGQLRIFSGTETLDTPFEAAFVRLNPGDYAFRREDSSLIKTPPDPRLVRRAEEVFTREVAKSFNIDLSDVSPDPWFLVPPPGDFISEVRTRRFGTLTYARNQNQPEDITLFNRERRRTVALYASADKLASQGPTYHEDELSDIDVTAYDIDASIDPARESITGRARVTVRVRAPYLATLTLRLAETLDVTSVASVQFGRLLHLRVRNQNAVLINLPTTMPAGSEITLVINYSGRVRAQSLDAEALALAQVQDDMPSIEAEPSYLLSNRSYWYPQNSVTDYASARVRIGLPEGWGCVVSGQATDSRDTSLRDLLGPVGAGRSFTFIAAAPVRYLSLVASRFVRVVDAVGVETPVDNSIPTSRRSSSLDVNLSASPAASPASPAAGADAPAQPPRERVTMALSVDANPRQAARAREVAVAAADILRFYSGLMADTPYPAMSIAVVEDDLPGGHSPAYATLLNSPPPSSQFLWRNDPAAFTNFPDFFLAHELAHQWWGQAVGWKNYHEQWLSEGFAQYFAALYAQRQRGDRVFGDMLRQFRRWAIAESGEGPIYLGYRLGHVKGDTRIFRALVYNKGAAVLHMLRRLVGDDAFFRGLRRFYSEQRYQKAGTTDFASAMEAESGMDLERFFERWIFGSALPRLRYTSTVANREVVVRFDQLTEEIFDVPVTVTITFVDGRVVNVIVPVTAARVEQRIPVDGIVRQVQINRDSAAIAQFDGS
jgi:hypothetical protein